MPLYNFSCGSCGKTFSKVTMALNESLPCPECGKDVPREVSMAVALICTPGSQGRKFAKQFGQKSKGLRQKHSIRD